MFIIILYEKYKFKYYTKIIRINNFAIITLIFSLNHIYIYIYILE